ncbi:putative enoyl CoA hydratase [Tieghemiomyces parasiticus]|uniref:Enoyl CoA hydratase n=1 Tax=Tieghemiomyces parasiticus TaxID=78921 RepID=A0A9W8AE53_9FUNG|nr:putative enoyl CoA hydratase [Tieghemiomyces parasiticus]
MAQGSPYGAFQCISATFATESVLTVQLNRSKQRNAMNPRMWDEIGECFRAVRADPDVRVVVLSGSGGAFSAGLDLKESPSDLLSSGNRDASRQAYRLRTLVLNLQASFTAIQDCDKPVIAAVHGVCIGSGVDMLTACDIRYCSADAIFSVKEVDLGLAADVGTLQRLQKVVGSDSWVREVCFTARHFGSDEALMQGLVSRVFPNPQALTDAALELASSIAAKSPVAVMGTKHLLNYSRDHTVSEGLAYTAVWNAAMLQSKVTTPAI